MRTVIYRVELMNGLHRVYRRDSAGFDCGLKTFKTDASARRYIRKLIKQNKTGMEGA